MRVIFLTGGPNVGKTTTTLELVRRKVCDYVITPGVWLRGIVAQRNLERPTPETDLANYVGNNWSNDVLEPLVLEHVRDHLRLAEARGAQCVIVEGYPRTAGESVFAATYAAELTSAASGVAVVVLDLSDEDTVVRGTQRARAGDDTATSLVHRLNYWRKNAETILAPAKDYVRIVSVASGQSVSMVADAIAALPLSPTAAAPHAAAAEAAEAPPSSFWRASTEVERAVVVQMQLRLAGCSKRRRAFCGSHPVSLDRPNLPRTLRYPYLCALKIDGTRFFCLVRDSTLWFLSRKLQVWRGPADARLAAFNDSLLDGELTMDDLFVVIDALVVGGRNVMNAPVIERLTHAAGIGAVMRTAAFRFRAQEYVDRTHLALLLERASTMPFRYDGVILQPAKLPVRVGLDYNLFKWKPGDHNTVDLLYNEDGLWCRKTTEDPLAGPRAARDAPRGSGCGCDAAEAVGGGTQGQAAGGADTDTSCGMLLTRVNGKICASAGAAAGAPPAWLRPGVVAEFSPVTAEGGELQWTPQRPRPDKLFPNLDWVVRNILDSIRDNITEAELVEYLARPPLAPTDVPSPPKRPRYDRYMDMAGGK